LRKRQPKKTNGLFVPHGGSLLLSLATGVSQHPADGLIVDPSELGLAGGELGATQASDSIHQHGLSFTGRLGAWISQMLFTCEGGRV
jgi:hypothetical protein